MSEAAPYEGAHCLIGSFLLSALDRQHRRE